MDQEILPKVTFGVTTTGNVEALQMGLTSVLLGYKLPAEILLRFEGEFPSFGTFYMEQLSELARVKGVGFSLTVGKSSGVRKARDWLLNHCTTDYLWMGDDDAIYSPHCLAYLALSAERIEEGKQEWGFIVGNKPDLNNRRGYADFSTRAIPDTEVQYNSSFNQFYAGKGMLVGHDHADTGNLLLNVKPLREKAIDFTAFAKSCNSGGEDTLFALRAAQAGLPGWFCSRADAFHLEKPNARFNEFAARKNMLLRECQLLKIDPAKVAGMMPWVKPL